MDIFGIDIPFSVHGANDVILAIKQITAAGRMLGMTQRDVQVRIGSLFTELKNSGKFSNAELAKLYTQFKQEPIKKHLEQIRNGGDRLKLLQSRFKEAILIGGQFYASLAPVRKMAAFADGVARMNYQLRMLHYSSGMGISALSAFGSAAKMYGGSEKTVGGFAQSYELQKGQAQYGQGLGIFERAAKFGIGFDFSETSDQFFERVVKTVRAEKDNERKILMAQELGGARKDELIARARLSQTEDNLRQKYFYEAKDWKTETGANRKVVVSEWSDKYNQEMKKFSRSWEGVKDQIAVAILPYVVKILQSIRKITDTLNKNPELINKIAKGLALVVGIISAISFVSATRSLLSFIGNTLLLLKNLRIIRAVMFSIRAFRLGHGALAVGGFLRILLGPLGKIIVSFSTAIAGFVKSLTLAKAALLLWKATLLTGKVALAAAVFAIFYKIGNKVYDWLAEKFGWDQNERTGNEDGSTREHQLAVGQRYYNLSRAIETKLKTGASGKEIDALIKRRDALKKRMDYYAKNYSGIAEEYQKMEANAERSVVTRTVNNNTSKNNSSVVDDHSTKSVTVHCYGVDEKSAEKIGEGAGHALMGAQMLTGLMTV